jgi:SAM-dependent methyltransferase
MRDYQRSRADTVDISSCARHALRVRAELERVLPFSDETRVLEVGSGAHGVVFFMGLRGCVGVDPLASFYRELFPWQRDAATIEARGEALPFETASFDVVICDNVVDHAESPAQILAEIARVLRPGGALFFSVNVHHWVYGLMSELHGSWLRIGPFADHTFHFNPAKARALLARLPVEIHREALDVDATLRAARARPARGYADLMKRYFFKNARYEVVARRR